MVKKILFFYLFSKRQFKQPGFLFILLLFPLFTFLFIHTGVTKETAVRVALTAESPDILSQITIEKLLDRQGLFQFYLSDSADALTLEVASGKAECGYILPDDLLEKLDRGKRNGLIDCMVSPDTTLNKIANEVVFSALFEEYSLHLLQGYLTGKSVLSDIDQEILRAQAESLYRLHMGDGSTFSVISDPLPLNHTQSAPAVLLRPIRGLIALLIFLSGFCGAINYYNDMENHTFDRLTKKSRQHMTLLSVFIPVFFSCLSGFCCIYLTRLNTTLLREVLSLFLYGLAITLFCTLLARIIRRKTVYLALIPVFLIGSLLFTPIFIDFTLILPGWKPVSQLFLPYYYLAFF